MASSEEYGERTQNTDTYIGVKQNSTNQNCVCLHPHPLGKLQHLLVISSPALIPTGVCDEQSVQTWHKKACVRPVLMIQKS